MTVTLHPVRFLAIAALAVAGAAGLALADAGPRLVVQLEERVEIAAYGAVRLGDVARLEGPAADAASGIGLGRAPAPGRRRGIARATVRAALESAGLAPASVRIEGPGRVDVRGAGRPLDARRVRRAVEDAVERHVASGALGEGGSARVTGVSVPRGVLVPEGGVEIEVLPLAHGARTGRNGLSLLVRAPGAPERRVPVQAELVVEGPVVVALREIPRGARIGREDLAVRTVRWPRVGALVRDLERAVGRVARSRLEVGEPVRERALGPALAVVRGRPVQATMKQGGVELTLQTIARADGLVGAIVPVVGVDGRSVVDARVTGPGRVLVLGSEEPPLTRSNEETTR